MVNSMYAYGNVKIRKLEGDYVIARQNNRIHYNLEYGEGKLGEMTFKCCSLNYDLKEIANEENGAIGITSHEFFSKCQNPFLVVEI